MRELQKEMEAQQALEDINEPANIQRNVSLERIIKHPLEHQWTFWFFENNKTKTWLDNLHKVYTFDTVEDFWCLYNHVRNVEDLTTGNDYMVFKEEIEPKWEDSRNNRGGRWICNVESRFKHRLNEMWLNLILFLIGESFDEHSDEICGAFINIRNKANKISLWTSDATKTEENTIIGMKLKHDCLQLDQEHKISYESHLDASKGSKARSMLSC